MYNLLHLVTQLQNSIGNLWTARKQLNRTEVKRSEEVNVKKTTLNSAVFDRRTGDCQFLYVFLFYGKMK